MRIEYRGIVTIVTTGQIITETIEGIIADTRMTVQSKGKHHV